jgi:hypothetical protein
VDIEPNKAARAVTESLAVTAPSIIARVALCTCCAVLPGTAAAAYAAYAAITSS